MTKSKKPKQNWTETEIFDICFFVIFDCYCKQLIFEEAMGTKLWVSTQLRDSSAIS